ncbi:class I adenylate-forming enzyme family protein [Paraburkholderia sp. IW21]|uniref:class I adenylate-forming enzyme family protein n=1 Tax=Paraburkholderia sp. IW21 TaxID=3242488 RepID=UPI0035209591
MTSILDQPDILFPDVIRHNARFHGVKTAVVCGDDRLNWREFHLRTNKVANALVRAGLQKGDRVCFFMQNSMAAFELIWGTIKAGGVVSPLNVMMAADSLPAMIDNAAPRFIFVDSELASAVDAVRGAVRNKPDIFYAESSAVDGWQSYVELVETGSEAEYFPDLKLSDTMTVLYSSGTTGVPKGSEHTHAARHFYSLGCGPALRMDPYSVALCATPLYTNGTWITLLPALYLGGTVVLARKLTPQAWLELVSRERVTHAFLVPTQCIGIVERASPEYDVSSLKGILYGGAPMTSQTAAAMAKTFPSARMYEIYGMSEGWCTLAYPEDRAHGRSSTVGKPVFGGDICVIDPEGRELPPGEQGELAGWSAGLMKGYLGDPQRTADIVWKGPHGRTYLRSGDIGYMDTEGFFFVNGRVKDMIISGGINVFASDIEEVFMQHPAVAEAAAIGIPHAKWGETPIVLVILRQGHWIDAVELKEWGNYRLGKFQRVSDVKFVDDFPRANYGKILKRVLREPYWEGRERSI